MLMQLATWDFEIFPRKDNHQNKDISSYNKAMGTGCGFAKNQKARTV